VNLCHGSYVFDFQTGTHRKREVGEVKLNIAARAVGAVIGALAVVVFAACTPNDGPAKQDTGSEQGGY
jgi:hypothetical protein